MILSPPGGLGGTTERGGKRKRPRNDLVTFVLSIPISKN